MQPSEPVPSHQRPDGDDSAAVLRLIFDHAGEGISVFDAQLRLVAWNARFVEMSGLPPALVRRGVRARELLLALARNGELGPAGQAAPEAAALERVRAISSGPAGVTYRVRPNGRTIETRRNPVPGGGFVMLYQDVSERRAAEAQLADQQRMLTLLVERTEQGFWFIDNELRTTDANPAMCRMLHTTREAMLGKTIYEFVDEENAEIFRYRTKLRAQGLASAYEITLTRADGSHVACWNNATPLFDAAGAKAGALGMFSDISSLKNTQQALIAARDEAERANRAKSDFLSRMSHELRTPLNAVLGFAQLLDTDSTDPLTPAQAARVHELQRGGHHLLSLINEVLDLSRIEAGALQLQLAPVPLSALVGECLRMVHPMAQARGIEMQVLPGADPTCAVLADPTRLKQVLLNLLSNAVKYNRDQGRVTLSWHGPAEHSPLVRIDVHDNGPGLSATQQERLFQAFERLDAEATEIEGAGIGLALSKWLVNLMRGEIGVDSTPGQGSTFWVKLHAAGAAHAVVEATAGGMTPVMPKLPEMPEMQTDAAAGAATASAKASTTGPTHTVLYVEDNLVNQLLMAGMLARRPGIRLITAPAGAEGLALAAQDTPDLVLLDIHLPGMDGYEVLRRLRQMPATRHVPAIAVSANAMPDDIEAARAAGFDDYVTKPLDIHLLLAAVERALKPC